MAPKKSQAYSTAFDTYSVSSQLGEGGSGRVFAVVSSAGETFALKLLDPAKATRDKLRRFKNEIFFGRSIEHPNIVPILDYGLQSDSVKDAPFYVMPLYASTLRRMIGGTYGADDILRAYAGILDGVEAAHLRGVCHRDLKPENILLSAQMQPAIADFGIARFTVELMQTTVETQPGARLANFAYASPEQRTGSSADHRSDIFSLGLILHELLTGVVPHGTSYKKISAVAPQLGYLDALVEQMLSHDPNDRPPTIAKVKEQLIARQMQFVSQQKLDAMKRTVVPSVSVTFEPVHIEGGEWTGDAVVFRLSSAPTPEWQHYARSGKTGTAYYVNYHPSRIVFSGKVATWPVDELHAQDIIGQFKHIVEKTNQWLDGELRLRAAKQEHEERERLRLAIEAEERRLATAAKLRF